MSIIDELITDRTQSDVTHWKELHDKGWAGMTDEEKAEWNTAAMKGAYNYTDLNRVTEAMDYLDETFTRYGYETGYRKIFVRNTSGLPDGYTELEYLQSSGTQYIDTGVKPNNHSRVVCRIGGFPKTAYSQAAFGARTSSSSSDMFAFMGAEDVEGYRSDFYNNKKSAGAVSFSNPFTIDKNENVTTLDGGVQITNENGTFSTPYSLFLFACNTGGSPQVRISGAKIYFCKIYDNGNLVRDYVPCLDPSQVPGMYDLVNGQFYQNAGSGKFVAGPTKEVTFLEYIESSGTQYIDTGVYPNQDTRVVCDVELLESGRAYGIFGSRIGYGNTSFDVFAFGLNSTQDFQDDYNKQSNAPLASSISKFLIDKNKNLTVINGVESIFSQSTFSVQYPMYLFGVNTSGTPKNQLGDLRVFSCQIYDNGTIVRNFIPCKDKNGLIGLYDTVEQRLYLNAGTGSFVAGPETGNTDSATPYTWTESDVPTASQMAQYIANVAALRGVVAVFEETPETPADMQLLTWTEANDIEKILVDINQLLINMAAAWFYSGEVYSGEVDA